MTAHHHVIHRQTVQRLQRLRALVTALLSSDLPGPDLAEVLGLSPAGSRKYVRELSGAGIIALAVPLDGTVSVVRRVFTLAVTEEQARAYLADLTVTAPIRAAKPSKSAISVAMRDSTRHVHLMKHDVQFSIRLNRTPPMRDPLVAAFFGAGQHEVRA